MNKGFQGARGCVTASDPEVAGFSKYRYTTRSIDDCADIAKRGGILCGSDPNAHCSYFIFTSRTLDDKLREADTQYNSGNVKLAMTYVEQVWRSLSRKARDEELLLAEKMKERFLNGFGRWVADDPQLLQRLKDLQDVAVTPLPMEGNCFVGGPSVINDPQDKSKPNPYVILSDEDYGMRSASTCRFNLFELPPDGTPGRDIQQQMVNMYIRRVAKERKQLEDIKNKLKKDQIALQVAQRQKRPEAMIAEIYAIEKDMKAQKQKEPYLKEIKKKKDALEKSLKGAKLFNYVAQTTNSAVQNSSERLKEKKDVLHKIDADINNINWSIQKNSNQEKLQNKITTTLGILIVLFIALCVALLIYYTIYEKAGPKTGSSVLAKPNSNAGLFGSMFTSKPKGGLSVAGTSKNKGVIDNIFSFS